MSLSVIAAKISLAALGLTVFVSFGLVAGKLRKLDETTAKSLGGVAFFLLYPSLFISGLSRNLDVETLQTVWPLPVFSVLHVALGFACGYLIARIANMGAFSKKAALAVATPNVTALPLFLAKLLCGPGGPLAHYPTSDRYVTYITLTVLPVLFFNFGFIPYFIGGKPRNASKMQDNEDISLQTFEDGKPTEQTPLYPKQESTRSEETPSSWKVFLEGVAKSINPATVGALIGLFIGLVPPLKALFFRSPSNPDPVLAVLMTTVAEVGLATVPILFIILGIRFSGVTIQSLKNCTVPARNILLIGFIRLFFLPLVGLLMVGGCVYLGFFPDDKICLFLTLLQFSPPSNIDLIVIFQLYEPEIEDLVVTMSYVYMGAVVTVSLWCGLFVYLLDSGLLY